MRKRCHVNASTCVVCSTFSAGPRRSEITVPGGGTEVPIAGQMMHDGLLVGYTATGLWWTCLSASWPHSPYSASHRPRTSARSRPTTCLALQNACVTTVSSSITDNTYAVPKPRNQMPADCTEALRAGHLNQWAATLCWQVRRRQSCSKADLQTCYIHGAACLYTCGAAGLQALALPLLPLYPRALKHLLPAVSDAARGRLLGRSKCCSACMPGFEQDKVGRGVNAMEKAIGVCTE